MIKRYFVLVILVLLTFHLPYAQPASSKRYGPQPEEGKSMPDFTLDNVTHFRSEKASLLDFKGKWLFLDFWFTGCITCIKDLPKINLLQQQFKDKIQFVLVGINDKKFNKGIESLYERLREKQNLSLVSAYDSVLIDRWGINSMPHIYIIDPEGIVRVIADGRDFTPEKIKDLIENKPVNFLSKARSPELTWNDSDSANNILYRSSITKYNGGGQLTRESIEDELPFIKKSELLISMVPLRWLYNLAYTGYTRWDFPYNPLYGKFYPYPILDIKDSSMFQFDYTIHLGKGTYTYNLVVPPDKVSVPYIMNIMQQDLKNTFGFEVTVENRAMAVWKLIANAEATKRLKTKGGMPHFEGGGSSGGVAGFVLQNLPMKRLLDAVMKYISYDQPPFIDATGITENIDITIDALMTNIEDIRKGLQKKGLDLVKGTRQMKVIVIRDPKNRKQ